jgi:hypothetical protein
MDEGPTLEIEKPIISRKKFLEISAIGIVATALMSACGGEQATPEPSPTPTQPTPGETPTPPSGETPTPTETPRVEPTPTTEPPTLPDDSVMAEVAGEQTLGGRELFSKQLIEVEAPYVGGEGEATVVSRFQELGARLEDGTEASVGWNIIGALPGAMTYQDEQGVFKSYNLKGAEIVQEEGKVFVEVNREVLSEIMHSGVAQYVDGGNEVKAELPIYIKKPEDLTAETAKPRLTIVPSENANEIPNLRIDWVGEDGEQAREGTPFSPFEGQSLTFDWEVGIYKDKEGNELQEFGLKVPEVESAMVEVITREEVVSWWQTYGEKRGGQLVGVEIQEDKYLDNQGNEVKMWKVVDGDGIVWARVFANVPRKPEWDASDPQREDMVSHGVDGFDFVEKVPGRLAVRYRFPEGYRNPEGNEQTTSLIFNTTADEERAGLKPVLKTRVRMINSSGPPSLLVEPQLWDGRSPQTQQTGIVLCYYDENQLPQSIRSIRGREYNDTIASWIPYIEKEGILKIAEIWRGMVKNEIPTNYVDGDYVPAEYRRSDWGDLPYQLVEQALNNVLEAIRRTPNPDQEQRSFIKDLVSEVRTIAIRGRYEEGTLPDLTYNTYDRTNEIIYLAFYRYNNGVSRLRSVAEKYRQDNTYESLLAASLVTASSVFHEGEWGKFTNAQIQMNYRRQLSFFNWLRDVFSVELSKAGQAMTEYINGYYVDWLERMASGES